MGALEVEEEDMAGLTLTDMVITGETIEEDTQTEQMVTVVGSRGPMVITDVQDVVAELMLIERLNPWMMLLACLLLRRCAFETKRSFGFRELGVELWQKKTLLFSFHCIPILLIGVEIGVYFFFTANEISSSSG